MLTKIIFCGAVEGTKVRNSLHCGWVISEQRLGGEGRRGLVVDLGVVGETDPEG